MEKEMLGGCLGRHPEILRAAGFIISLYTLPSC